MNAPNFDALPAEVRAAHGWLVWRLVQRQGEPKPRKVPYYISGGARKGRQGSSDDRAQLATFDEARARLAELELKVKPGTVGIGLALLPEWGLTALDFDACVTNGVVDAKVLELTEGTYREISPSGKGVRAFMRGEAGDRKAPKSDSEFGFETFSGKGFVTVTGNVPDSLQDLAGDPPAREVTQAIRDYCLKRFGKAESASTNAGGTQLTDISDEQLTDLKDALAHPALREKAGAESVWSEVGLSLLSLGEVGEDLWLEFSEHADNYEPGAPETWWERHQGTIPKADFRHVFKMAGKLGWSGRSKADLSMMDDLSALEIAVEPVSKSSPLAFRPLSDFASRPFPRWYVKGLLPEADLGMIFGPSGSGKSFLAFDIACALARGVKDWGGRRVRPARVGWIAAEATGSVGLRARAYARHHGIEVADITLPVIAYAPDMGNKKHVADIVQGVEDAGIEVLFVDTLAAVSGGRDENTVEMQVVMNGCRRVRDETGAMVVVIHHSGKDLTKGARGSTAIKATVDWELEVNRFDESLRIVSITKMRDGADTGQMGFKLTPVIIGVDEDDDPVTSCVLELSAVEGKKPKPKKLGPYEQALMTALQELTPYGIDAVPLKGVDIGDLLTEAVKSIPQDPDSDRDRRREALQRAALTCATKGLCLVDGATVTLT